MKVIYLYKCIDSYSKIYLIYKYHILDDINKIQLVYYAQKKLLHKTIDQKNDIFLSLWIDF